VTAWRNLSAYPDGHPARAAALRNAHSRLASLLQASGAIELGISKEGILHGETSFSAPHARALAQALHIRSVAVLRFEEGVEASELERILRHLVPLKAGATPRPLEADLAGGEVQHVSVVSVDYGALATSDEVSPLLEEPTSLWNAILRTLLSGKLLSPDGVTPISGEAYTAEGLASLLASSAGNPATAGSFEAALGAVSEHLNRSRGPAWAGAVQQLGELVRALPKDIRDRILESALSLAASEDRGEDLLPLLESMLEPNELLRAMRQLSASGVKLSPHALKLIHTLSSDARRKAEQEPGVEAGTRALVEQLSSLFEEEDIDRYNPEDHQELLDQATAVDMTSVWPAPAEDPAALGAAAETLTEDAIAAATTRTLLDLVAAGDAATVAAPLARLQTLFGDALATGQMQRALDLTDELRRLAADPAIHPAVSAAIAAVLGRFASESIPRILQSPATAEETAASLRELVSRLGAAATAGLLQALTVEKDKSRRRKLFDLLVSLGPDIVPETRRLLQDKRWFVVRNMVALLRGVEDRSSLAEIRRCADHEDIRIRLEAIKTLLAFDPSVPKALLEKAINDKDPKIAEAAVTLTGQYGIREARDPLIRILRRWDPLGVRSSLRLKALRALADLGDGSVLPALVRFFRNWRIPLVQLEERRLAFKLLEAYPEADRRPYVEKGLRSRDLVIRRSCEKLRTSTSQAVSSAAAATFEGPSGEEGS